MTPSETSPKKAVDIDVENIGGIDNANVVLHPGVNVFAGRNATNRTSFLQAIMAALGSQKSSLKGDADEGKAELKFEDGQYTRYLERRNNEVYFDGEPYLDDPELADLFAFLLETNEARQAVARGDDLREIIMQPIDTDEIEAKISTLEEEKRSIDTELEELDQLSNELPDLEEQRVSLKNEIDTTSEQIEELKNEIELFDIDLEESRDQKKEIEETFTQLQSEKQKLESIEYDLETERETRDKLKQQQEELEVEFKNLDDEFESPDRLEGRIQELRNQKQSLDTTLNELQSVINFNEERLADDGIDLGSSFDTGDSDGNVTDKLVDSSDEIVCWTCGSEVKQTQIESTLDKIRSLHHDKLTERKELQKQIDDLSSKKNKIQQEKQKVRNIKNDLSTIKEEIKDKEEIIDELEGRRADQKEKVNEIESEANEFKDTDYSEVIDLHKQLNQHEIELEQLKDERDEVTTQIDEIQDKIGKRDKIEEQRKEIVDELADLRTRVDQIEENAIDAFNEHMASILSILEYKNIDRIWIERRDKTVREGRRKTTKTVFDMHVIRTSVKGTTYEDTVDHLSESEREVTGLIFALAGFLVHDVHEIVPVILLDSLEAIDSERIADLVEYFESYVDYLVVALLHEDADALPNSYTYIENI